MAVSLGDGPSSVLMEDDSVNSFEVNQVGYLGVATAFDIVSPVMVSGINIDMAWDIFRHVRSLTRTGTAHCVEKGPVSP